MELEKILIGEIRTSGLEMYTPNLTPKLPTHIDPPSFCDGLGRSPSHPHYGGTLGRLRENELRPIKPTEILKINLSEICPGLNLVEKYHPPKPPEIKLPSYEALFGIKKKKGSIFSDGKIDL